MSETRDGQRYYDTSAPEVETIRISPRAARNKIQSLQAENKKLVERCAEIGGERDIAYGESHKLKTALLRYGNHDENCYSVADETQGGPDTCDCGLDEGFKLCQPIP